MSEIPPPTVPPATPPPPGGGSYTPPPPPPPGGPAPGQSSDRGLMIFLSYFGIFSLIPLLTKKDDPDIQWHAKNGLVLAIAWVIFWIAFTFVSFVLPWGIRVAWNGIGCICGLAFFIVDIMAMVKGINGQRMRIPVTTDLAEKM